MSTEPHLYRLTEAQVSTLATATSLQAKNLGMLRLATPEQVEELEKTADALDMSVDRSEQTLEAAARALYEDRYGFSWEASTLADVERDRARYRSMCRRDAAVVLEAAARGPVDGGQER